MGVVIGKLVVGAETAVVGNSGISISKISSNTDTFAFLS